MLVIGVTGLPGAGKSIFSEVAKEFGIPVISMGDLVKEQVKKLGLDITPENVGKIAIKLREKNGPDAVAKLVIEKILEEPSLKESKVLIIDGIRSLAEVELFKKHFYNLFIHFENFIIVAIHAPPNQRYQRLLARGRRDDAASLEKILERERRELSFGIGNVIALANYILVNDGTIQEFKVKVREFLRKIINQAIKDE